MNGPRLYIKTCEGNGEHIGDAFVPIEDVGYVRETKSLTVIDTPGRHYYTHTPAAEIVTDLNRLRAEHENDPTRVDVDIATLKRHLDEHERFRKALVRISNKPVATGASDYAFICGLRRTAKEALYPPASEVEPKPSDNRAAIALVNKWLADMSGYDEATWPEIKEAICPEPTPKPESEPRTITISLDDWDRTVGECDKYVHGPPPEPEAEPTQWERLRAKVELCCKHAAAGSWPGAEQRNIAYRNLLGLMATIQSEHPDG